MKSSLFGSLFILGIAGSMSFACASSNEGAETGESQDELTARAACRGKSAGDTCSLCGNDSNCVETMVLKTCQKRGAQLRCSASSQPVAPPAYDPCGGKNAGDTCQLCAPNDSDCMEAQVVKTCGLTNGKLTCNAGTTAPAPAYQPCAGKRVGETCTLCAPNDPDCLETMELKVCNASGECTSQTK